MDERLSFEPVNLAGSGNAEARLVFFDRKLVAVVAKLDDTNEELSGHWYAEAIFNGLEPMREKTFATFEHVSSYMLARLTSQHRK